MAAGLALNRSRQVPAEDTPAFGGIAERFRRAGDLDRAVQLCRDGLKKFPDHLSARVTLGWALLDQGKYDDARIELEQALKRAPDNLAAIRGLAELHDRAEHTMMLPMDGPGQWPPDAETIDALQSAPSRADASFDFSINVKVPAAPEPTPPVAPASMAPAVEVVPSTPPPPRKRIKAGKRASSRAARSEAATASAVAATFVPVPLADPELVLTNSAGVPIGTPPSVTESVTPVPVADVRPVEIETPLSAATAAMSAVSAAIDVPVIDPALFETSSFPASSTVSVADEPVALETALVDLTTFDQPDPLESAGRKARTSRPVALDSAALEVPALEPATIETDSLEMAALETGTLDIAAPGIPAFEALPARERESVDLQLNTPAADAAVDLNLDLLVKQLAVSVDDPLAQAALDTIELGSNEFPDTSEFDLASFALESEAAPAAQASAVVLDAEAAAEAQELAALLAEAEALDQRAADDAIVPSVQALTVEFVEERGHGEELESTEKNNVDTQRREATLARGAGVGRLRAEGASASWAEALAEARPRAPEESGQVSELAEAVALEAPVIELAAEPVAVVEPVFELAAEPVAALEPVIELAAEPVAVVDPVIELSTDTVAVFEPVIELAAEPVAVVDPVIELAAEPVAVVEPVIELTAESVAVVDPIAVVEPVVEFAEPVAVREPVVELAAEPAAEVPFVVELVAAPSAESEAVAEPVVVSAAAVELVAEPAVEDPNRPRLVLTNPSAEDFPDPWVDEPVELTRGLVGGDVAVDDLPLLSAFVEETIEIDAEALSRPQLELTNPGVDDFPQPFDDDDVSDEAVLAALGSPHDFPMLSYLESLPDEPEPMVLVEPKRSPRVPLERFLHQVQSRHRRLLAESVV